MNEDYDIAVIGGGPAGLMAAGRAAELGARVVLIEKNNTLGNKLLLTGKGRCNITNDTEDVREMVQVYGKNGKFLLSSFFKFGPKETIRFFNERSVKTKTERGNRVFPASDNSLHVLNALKRYLKKNKVALELDAKVKRFVYPALPRQAGQGQGEKDGKIEKLVLANGRKIKAGKYIICTGGKSYSFTGSTGEGYVWAKKMGHTIEDLAPALTPVITEEKLWTKQLEGLSLKNVEISVWKNDKKIDSRFGEALFTADGMSGPIILDMSKNIGKAFPGAIKIKIDFKPALSFEKLDKRIQRDFEEGSKKMYRNILDKLLPKKLIPLVIELSGIPSAKKVSDITKEERNRLVHLMKEFEIRVKKLTGYRKAIVTSGGVKLSEIDPNTMKSKLIDNLYFAGEVIDIDGPTGGYNLQICWSTGRLAGESATQQ